MDSGRAGRRFDAQVPPADTSGIPGFRDSSLPRWRTPLIGRERLTGDLVSLLRTDDMSLVTLTGPGGVGKTRLAVEVARALTNDFPDGIVFVPLDKLEDVDLVIPTVAATFGLSDTGGHQVIDRLVERLHHLRLLLILDNLEHVIDVAPVLSHLLARCPHLTMLVTSRVVLRVTGEYVVQVDPLAPPAAVELFVSRARAVNASFLLTAAASTAVGRICARLEGVPLALELAAAWAHTLPPQSLLSRLDQALPLLSTGARDQPARQRTMRNAIAWSYDLLTPAEQRLFRQLAVFVGGIPLDAVVSTEANEYEVVDTIGSLVSQSILHPIGQGDDPVPRYQMLETVRQFGIEQLTASGEEPTVRRGHAGWCTRLAMTAEQHLNGGQQAVWHARLETELPNIRSALAWATQHDLDMAMQLCASLQQFWIVRGNLVEAQQALSRVLASRGGAPALRARTMVAAGWIHVTQSNAPACLDLATAACDAFRRLGDLDGTAESLIAIGFACDASGHEVYDDALISRAIDALTEAKTLGQQLGNRRIIAQANYGLGSMAQRQGRIDRAVDFFSLALHDFDACADERSIAWIASRIGELAIREGDTKRAAEALQRALPIFARLRDWWSALQAVLEVAHLALCVGRPHEAVQLLSAIDAIRSTEGLTLSHAAIAVQADLLSQARARLSEEECRAAVGQGQQWTMHEAIAQALDLANAAATSEISIPPLTATFDLTQRELDVLRLLAAGLSDRDIADRLSLSPRTVGAHVTHLLTKLHVESRTAAAVLAVRTGLA